MKKIGFLALLCALFMVSTLQATQQTAPTSNTPEPQNHMTLATHDGKTIDINITSEGFVFNQFPGKTVILDFFGPMCPPCIIELPHLVELQNAHKDDLQIIAIQVQMPMENAELAKFVEKNKVNYPMINLNDAWDLVAFVKANTNWGGQIPFMLMFDKSGKLKQNYLGVVSNEQILSDMKK